MADHCISIRQLEGTGKEKLVFRPTQLAQNLAVRRDIQDRFSIPRGNPVVAAVITLFYPVNEFRSGNPEVREHLSRPIRLKHVVAIGSEKKMAFRRKTEQAEIVVILEIHTAKHVIIRSQLVKSHMTLPTSENGSPVRQADGTLHLSTPFWENTFYLFPGNEVIFEISVRMGNQDTPVS